MATTKYIVNNASGQVIDGNITINGGMTVTGPSNGFVTYKAILTQLGVQTGTDLNDFNGGLIIGETYEILNYQSGDDFSNIANVLSGVVLTYTYSGTSVTGITNTYTSGGVTSGEGSGIVFEIVVNNDVYESVNIDTIGYGYVSGDIITILGTNVGGISPDNDITITIDSATTDNPNETGSIFITTGELPTNWNNGSTLESSGNLVVKVLENNLGYDIEWVTDFMSPGFYLGFNKTTGPLYNTFNRNSTFIQGGNKIPTFGPYLLDSFILPYSAIEKDDSILIAVFDLTGPTPVPDNLYYYPVEVQILQDTDTTSIEINGTVESSFPINYTSIDLRCNGNYIQPIYGEGTVNDMSELITYLNSEPNMSYLGTYDDDGVGGVALKMPTNLVNQFCSNGTLTFEVFND